MTKRGQNKIIYSTLLVLLANSKDEIVYSLNDEDYYDSEEFAQILETETQNKESFTVFVGTKISYTHDDWIEGTQIAEGIQMWILDNIDKEVCQDYLDEFDKKEVINGIEKAVIDFLNKNVPQLKLYNVKTNTKLEVIK